METLTLAKLCPFKTFSLISTYTKSENKQLFSKFELNFRSSFKKLYFNLYNDLSVERFLQAYSLTSLVKEATCFQSSNPSCIDLTLTNQIICINSPICINWVI